MNSEIEEALTIGLIQGYGGDSIRRTSKGGVPGLSSDIYLSSGAHYHDHWFGVSSGGGQETVISGNDRFTRLYGGGVVDEDTLSIASTNATEVHAFLQKQIRILGANTRLRANCLPPADGDWKYEYAVDSLGDNPEITTGTESIFHQRHLVFRHHFILVPIR